MGVCLWQERFHVLIVFRLLSLSLSVLLSFVVPIVQVRINKSMNEKSSCPATISTTSSSTVECTHHHGIRSSCCKIEMGSLNRNPLNKRQTTTKDDAMM